MSLVALQEFDTNTFSGWQKWTKKKKNSIIFSYLHVPAIISQSVAKFVLSKNVFAVWQFINDAGNLRWKNMALLLNKNVLIIYGDDDNNE